MTSRRRSVSSEDIHDMAKLLSVMVASVVDEPDYVSISVENTATEITLSIEVDDNDVGFVYGHHGVNIDAIRRVMVAAARAREIWVRVRIPQAENSRARDGR